MTKRVKKLMKNDERRTATIVILQLGDANLAVPGSSGLFAIMN